MLVWRARCQQEFGDNWGVPMAYTVDGAVRRPHDTLKMAHWKVRITDSVFADDTATVETNL